MAPKTDRKRRPAHIADSKYKTEDGHQQKYFHGKAEARKAAMVQSSIGTVILCQRVAGGGWEMIARYRFGRAA